MKLKNKWKKGDLSFPFQWYFIPNKRGATYVEASIVLPVMILSIISIISIGISMYEKIDDQCIKHLQKRSEIRREEAKFARKVDLVMEGVCGIEELLKK